jgi:hypothetical protein
VVPETEAEARHELLDADAAYGWVPPDMLSAATKLRWLQNPQDGPALVVHRLFMQEFLVAEPPCLAWGLVEERQQLCGMLALRLDEALPPAIADRGFAFGHA